MPGSRNAAWGGTGGDGTGTVVGQGNYPSVVSAATITIPPGASGVLVTGTTGITAITAGYAGQIVTLVFSGALTVTDGGNLRLAGNFVTTPDDSLTLVCDGANWTEIARAVN